VHPPTADALARAAGLPARGGKYFVDIGTLRSTRLQGLSYAYRNMSLFGGKTSPERVFTGIDR
jgi:hypothetical protein